MGQYLAIGLTTHIFVRKEKVDKAQLTIEDLQRRMKEKFYINPKIYTLSSQDKHYCF